MKSKYFTCLFIAAAIIAGFPLTMRGQNEKNSRIIVRDEASDNGDIQQSNRGTYRAFVAPDRKDREYTVRIFRVSAYDADCRICCGEYAAIPLESGQRRTASGYRLKPDGSDAGRLCAAPANYPFGTRFDIPGYGQVTCRDRGGKIKAAGTRITGADRKTYILDYDRLDILFKTHRQAQEFGIKYLQCKVIYEQ